MKIKKYNEYRNISGIKLKELRTRAKMSQKQVAEKLQLEGIDLTKDNVKFPTHFYRTNKELEGVKEVENEEITKQIRNGIDFLRENKDEFSWYVSYGDLFVSVFRFEGDEIYSVYVTRDFYNTEIPFEESDY